MLPILSKTKGMMEQSVLIGWAFHFSVSRYVTLEEPVPAAWTTRFLDVEKFSEGTVEWFGPFILQSTEVWHIGMCMLDQHRLLDHIKCNNGMFQSAYPFKLMWNTSMPLCIQWLASPQIPGALTLCRHLEIWLLNVFRWCAFSVIKLALAEQVAVLPEE